MGIMSPQAPLTEGVAKAVCKGIQRNLVPEQRLPTLDQIKVEQAKRATKPRNKTDKVP